MTPFLMKGFDHGNAEEEQRQPKRGSRTEQGQAGSRRANPEHPWEYLGQPVQSGQVVYNVTIDRLWKDDDQANEGGEVIKRGEWHQSQSFGRDDLLIVAKVADLCHTWIYREIQDQAREQSF